MEVRLALGLVLDLGGVFGQGEGDIDGDTIGDIAESTSDSGGDIDSDFFDFKPVTVLASLAVALFLPLYSLAADAVKKADSWYHHVAFYIGPLLEIGPFYITGGACLGGFGCFAVGFGIHFGGWGIGVLFPVWLWW